MQHKPGDLLIRGVLREFLDAVAAIGEAGAFLADRADTRLAGDDSG
jgi:hypothetical protein